MDLASFIASINPIKAYPITRDYSKMWECVNSGIDLACKDGMGTPYHWGTCGRFYHSVECGKPDMGVYISIPEAFPKIEASFNVYDTESKSRFIKFCNQHSIDFIDPIAYSNKPVGSK